ncbi:hypothetical protein KEH51_25365 [[Brevibacterium] frigoritolerans]|uniref:Uncharacterized protein n=1 Tax=Peribacillus frigoritolerans TaxID=450367 RepID=A0A941J7U5_9BACI|nr:hypothetical protein [Peribacillus frigoritolerans]
MDSGKKISKLFDSKMIRYRPYFTLDEMIYYLTNNSGYLCHPIIRDKADPVRRLIQHIENGHNSELYTNKEYPWYEDNPNNYSISLPIKGKFGLELIVRSGSTLTHYWQHPGGNGINLRHSLEMLREFLYYLKLIQVNLG